MSEFWNSTRRTVGGSLTEENKRDVSRALAALAANPPSDEFDPIPWFTEKDAQQALERMHAFASTSDPLMRLVWDLLDDTQRLNLARVAYELRPR